MSRDAMPIVAVSVLNWNGWEHTRACLDALLAQDVIVTGEADLHVIVVDNASGDGSGDRLRNWIASRRNDRLHFIQADRNRGFSGGNNLAIRHALDALGADFLWVLNNDTLPHPDAVTALLGCARQQPTAAILGSTLIDPVRGTIQAAGGCRYYPWLSAYRNCLSGRPAEHLENLPRVRMDYVAGAALFVRAGFFRETGLMDERYFLYYEELELARRLPPGNTIAWCRASLVEHQGGASMKSTEGQATAVYHSTRSCLIYTKRWHPWLLPGVLAVRILVKSAEFAGRRKWHLYKPLFGGIRDGLIGK